MQKYTHTCTPILLCTLHYICSMFRLEICYNFLKWETHLLSSLFCPALFRFQHFTNFITWFCWQRQPNARFLRQFVSRCGYLVWLFLHGFAVWKFLTENHISATCLRLYLKIYLCIFCMSRRVYVCVYSMLDGTVSCVWKESCFVLRQIVQ